METRFLDVYFFFVQEVLFCLFSSTPNFLLQLMKPSSVHRYPNFKMEFTDLYNLTEGSEQLTPLKAQPSFEIAQDSNEEEDNAVVKIPHGLTAKRNRRKSFHPETATNNLFTLTPKRAPLTAPRNNILNSQPIHIDLAKRSLVGELQSLRGGKENSPIKSALSFSPLKFTNKRLSSEVTGLELNKPKHQKVEEKGDNDDDVILVHPDHSALTELDFSFAEYDNHKDLEEEELSRIEPFTENNGHANSSVLVSTQDDNEITVSLNNDQVIASEHFNVDMCLNINKESNSRRESSLQELITKPSTPARVTEPVAISPKTEQNSRVVDESLLMLDTTKSPNLDDSYIAESPLSQHNLGIDKQSGDLLDNLDDVCLSPQKRTHLSTPNQRPFFTIAQVHEIQNEFRNEVEKLEETLKSKSKRILELNNEINQSNNNIYQLQDTIESLKLQQKQILKDNDLMKSEQCIFQADMAKLESSLKGQDERLARQKVLINKFKERVQELQLTIVEKNNEVVNLNEDIESKARAIKSLQLRASDFEKQAQHLAARLNEEVSKNQESSKTELRLQSEIDSAKNELESLSKELASTNIELMDAKELAKTSAEQLDSSNQINKAIEDQITSLKTEYSEKLSEIDTLKAAIAELETQMAAGLNYSSEEKCKLQKELTMERKSVELKNAIIDGLRAGISTLNISLLSFKDLLRTQSIELAAAKSDLSESNELLTIRKAEVDELNIEITQYKRQMLELTAVVESKDSQVSHLSNLLEQNRKELQTAKDKIQELDLEIQKQETDHLTELEAFHTEMSNVQNMVSNKSNDLYKMKDTKEKLTKDNDLLRYQIETLKEDAAQYESRVSNMKVKLQEVKQYSQNLEARVSKLKEERASLESETDKRLQQLAEDLYIQYSKKHEQKVSVLKKGYETKWLNKVSKIESENEKLRREIEGLRSQLETETNEKNEIIKLWDKFRETESSRE